MSKFGEKIKLTSYDELLGVNNENEGTKEKTAHRRDGCVKGVCYIGSCPLPCNAGAVSGRLSRSQYVFSTIRISDL